MRCVSTPSTYRSDRAISERDQRRRHRVGLLISRVLAGAGFHGVSVGLLGNEQAVAERPLNRFLDTDPSFRYSCRVIPGLGRRAAIGFRMTQRAVATL